MMPQDGDHPTVLLIEDDLLLGLDLGDILAEAGYRVAGPLRTEAEAEAWMAGSGLAGRVPDLAILDLPLRDGDGSRLAGTLRARGIPFLVQAPCLVHAPSRPGAGDAHDAMACAALRAAPRLTKPAWPRDLVLVLGTLAREARP
ncbi:response regulator [Methylobacterium terricola]|uniref:Response regulator n=1 Tax=Methylobacterium terricola TaxID=2583531 RepID=A0A5C4LMS7_9HYPH|nr:response regulator [Methylobacterium terricola]TNC16132.1 response regulator [Methylobacterium terricola]